MAGGSLCWTLAETGLGWMGFQGDPHEIAFPPEAKVQPKTDVNAGNIDIRIQTGRRHFFSCWSFLRAAMMPFIVPSAAAALYPM
jgi:hypothetical protein